MYKMYKKECCPSRVVVLLSKGLFTWREEDPKRWKNFSLMQKIKGIKDEGDNSGDIKCWPFCFLY